MDPSFDPYAARSRHIINEYHSSHGLLRSGLTPLPELKDLLDRKSLSESLSKDPVCIIGAGTAGLYTALILDSLQIPYKIFETSNRVGGRLFTYSFGKPDCSDYQYYDVGAMRFPKTVFMDRTFKLVERLKNPPKWIKYNFASDGTKAYFNGHLPPPGKSDDPYNIKTSLPDRYKDLANPDLLKATVEGVMSELKMSFRNVQPGDNLDKIFEDLFKTYDGFSMRTFLASKGYPPVVIDLMETFDKSTGWYDRALVETICESLAFESTGSQPGELDWRCFDKGAEQLPKAMQSNLPSNVIQFNTKVERISFIDGKPSNGLKVNWTREEGKVRELKSENFSAVISTVPFGRLSLINMSGAGIHNNWAQWSAIRELQYGPAVKIGIRFKENWWEQMGIVGGQSFTDLPIRTTVYPTYPDKGTKSNVLIASYCWTQDAERLGALIKGDAKTQSELLDLVLEDLTVVHGGRDALLKLNNPHIERGDLRTMIQNVTTDVFAWDWLHDPNTMGGYAFFGPQQFESTYPQVTKAAASGQLFFAGEACSTTHAWVAGALEGSWTAVHNFLDCFGTKEQKDQFIHKWGSSAYWDSSVLTKHLRLGLHEEKLAHEAAQSKGE